MKLLILDGNSVINRAFFGVRPLTTREGLYTHAIYGFLNILEKAEKEEQPDAPAKKSFFDKQYEETYSGNGVLFDVNDYIYVFNSNESKITDSTQTVSYTLPESNIGLKTAFEAHTYAVFKEEGNKLNIEMCNIRLDSDKICAGLESEYEFIVDYIYGGKRSNPGDFRASVIELTGYEREPQVSAKGTNSAKMKTQWNEETKTLTLTVISNGEVRITVE